MYSHHDARIQKGQTIDQVKSLCGAPNNSKSTTKPNDTGPQELTFYPKIAPNAQNTVKLTVILLKNAVTNITLNSVAMTSSLICGQPIQLGMTKANIITVCGKPAFTNQGVTDDKTPKEIQMDELSYTGAQNITLLFENNKLIGTQ